MRAVALVLLCLVGAACGVEPTADAHDVSPDGDVLDTSTGVGATDAGATDAAADIPDAPPRQPQPWDHFSGTCESQDLEVYRDRGGFDEQGRRYIYGGTESPFTRSGYTLVIGPNVQPGSYDLSVQDPATCDVCVTYETGCRDLHTGCDATASAIEGGVELELAMDAHLKGNLFKVRFDLQPDPGCLHDQPFDLDLTTTGGARLGETVHRFELVNCATQQLEPVFSTEPDAALHWLFLTATWCSACAQYIPVALEQQLINPWLDVSYILIQDAEYNPPTIADCRDYAAWYGVPMTSLFIDPNGERTNDFFNVTSLVLPWNALVDAQTMTYEFGGPPDDDFVDTFNRYP